MHEFYLANCIADVDKIKLWPKTLEPVDTAEVIAFHQNLSQKLFQKVKPIT